MHLPQRKCRQSNRPSTTKAFWSLNSCVMNLLRVTWKSWEKRYEQLLFTWVGDSYIFKTKWMNWAPSFLLPAPLEFNMTMRSCHNSRCPFIQTAGWNRLDGVLSWQAQQNVLLTCSFFAFPLPPPPCLVNLVWWPPPRWAGLPLSFWWCWFFCPPLLFFHFCSCCLFTLWLFLPL